VLWRTGFHGGELAQAVADSSSNTYLLVSDDETRQLRLIGPSAAGTELFEEDVVPPGEWTPHLASSRRTAPGACW
jgi:hypothetical protein